MKILSLIPKELHEQLIEEVLELPQVQERLTEKAPKIDPKIKDDIDKYLSSKGQKKPA